MLCWNRQVLNVIIFLMFKAAIFDYGHTLLDNENAHLYKGTEQVLEYLDEKGVKLALVSGTNKEEFRRQQLNEFGIYPYFSYIDFLPHSDTKNFQPILKQFKVKPEEVLVVGDRITSEIKEAKKLGMKTCRVLRGPEKNFVPENELETPDYTIEELIEIIHLFS